MACFQWLHQPAKAEAAANPGKGQRREGDQGNVPAQGWQAFGSQARDQYQACMHAEGGGQRQQAELGLDQRRLRAVAQPQGMR